MDEDLRATDLDVCIYNINFTEEDFLKCINLKSEDESKALWNIIQNADDKGYFKISGCSLDVIKSLGTIRISKPFDEKYGIANTDLIDSYIITYSTKSKDENVDIVIGRLSKPICEILDDLKKIPNKTYVLSNKSVYFVGLYMLLKPYLETRMPLGALVADMDIEVLREKLGVTDKYERISQLKDKVIQPALDNINEIFNSHIDCSWIKDGKSVVCVRFTISNAKPIKIGGKSK